MQVNLNNLEIDYWIKHWINYTYVIIYWTSLVIENLQKQHLTMQNICYCYQRISKTLFSAIKWWIEESYDKIITGGM